MFGAILDPERGGSWTISTARKDSRTHQFYFPQSAALITRFLTADGVIEVHDFMPVLQPKDEAHVQRLVRRVVAVRGTTTVSMVLDARPITDAAVSTCSRGIGLRTSASTIWRCSCVRRWT